MSLRILLYCDHEEIVSTYKTERLQAVLGAHHQVKTAFRKAKGDAVIDEALLAGCDEIWFLLRATDSSLALTTDEKACLQTWMDGGGGVLVTGDHAEVTQGEGTTTYRGLGSAVGEGIPLAGLLRGWHQAPGPERNAYASDGGDVPEPTDRPAEQDATPQRLLLPIFGDKPHPIFQDPRLGRLDRLPDHMHEGKLLIPETEAPRPEVIAKSIDWKRGEVFAAMVAWDRELKGRIVADASWHHYVDFNLVDIGENNPHWPKIRQLYLNLAWWLAPSTVRQRHVAQILKQVGEQIAADPATNGKTPVERAQVARTLLANLLPGPWLAALDGDLLRLHGIDPKLAEALPQFSDFLLDAHLRDAELSITSDVLKHAFESYNNQVSLSPELAFDVRITRNR